LASILPFDTIDYPLRNISESAVKQLVNADKVLDIRGWSSPWSILKTKSELNLMEPGQTLEVLISDPGDLPAVLSRTNHRLIATEDQVGFYRLYVRRGLTGTSGSITELFYDASGNQNHGGGRDDNRRP